MFIKDSGRSEKLGLVCQKIFHGSDKNDGIPLKTTMLLAQLVDLMVLSLSFL